MYYSSNPYPILKVVMFIIAILQIKKLWLKEMPSDLKRLAQDHTASKWKSVCV